MRCFLAATLVLLSALPAIPEPSRWKSVGSWDVSFYAGQEGCLAYTRYQRGTHFYIGFDSTFPDIHMDVTLIDDRWESLEPGKEYSITVRLGNEAPWNLDMTAQRFGDEPGLLLNYPAGSDQARRFMREFMRETKMIWSYEGNILGDYSLRGSGAALNEVVACQRSFEEAANGAGDLPSSRERGSDPFAQ